jgi:heme/copper-type cytochrome/quinol oxidase subunit 3
MPPDNAPLASAHGGGSDPRQRRQVANIGLYLLLASLSMLFASSMLVYLLIRTRIFGNYNQIPPLGAIHVPLSLLLSTAIMLFSSYTIHLAHAAVRRERQAELRRHLLTTLLLAIAFILVQAPSLAILLRDHYTALHGSQRIYLYGMIFVLIMLHAAHVIGGIIALSLTLKHAYAGRYDHEHHQGVRHAALYWHFLDIVWLIMFILFFALR